MFENEEYKLVENINCWEETIQTYNLKTVEKNHTFYAENVLVHNKSCFTAGTKIMMSNGEQTNIENVKI
jgi:hypothetical protein